MEIVKDLGDGRFIARNRKGEEITLKTINAKEIERSHKERIKQAAKKVNRDEILKVKGMASEYIMRVVDIDDWYTLADNFANEVNNLYEKIGRPNIFYYSVKHISPQNDGKAETFRKRCSELKYICDEILEEIANMA